MLLPRLMFIVLTGYSITALSPVSVLVISVLAMSVSILLYIIGAQYLVEVTTLMGDYAQTSFYLNAFEAELPDDVTEPLLPV